MTESPYPPLTLNSSGCHKCGITDRHYVKYERESALVTVAGEYVVQDEWMLRTCRTCDFSWREAPRSPGVPTK